MKVGILAGGLGTRLSEETTSRPKPMVEVGGRPMLWHIMKLYSAHGFNEFVVALGYKAEVIQDYFLNYRARSADLTIRTGDGETVIVEPAAEDWTVHLINTGDDTMTGGRVKRLAEFIGDEPFMLTYGDAVADVDLTRLVAFHRERGKKATITAVRPPARFGSLEFDGDLVTRFAEKHQSSEGWINGGFFVLEPGMADRIAGDPTIFEREPLEGLADEGELVAYKHSGFWQCMDTVRDLAYLEELWASGRPDWKIW